MCLMEDLLQSICFGAWYGVLLSGIHRQSTTIEYLGSDLTPSPTIAILEPASSWSVPPPTFVTHSSGPEMALETSYTQIYGYGALLVVLVISLLISVSALIQRTHYGALFGCSEILLDLPEDDDYADNVLQPRPELKSREEDFESGLTSEFAEVFAEFRDGLYNSELQVRTLESMLLEKDALIESLRESIYALELQLARVPNTAALPGRQAEDFDAFSDFTQDQLSLTAQNSTTPDSGSSDEVSVNLETRVLDMQARLDRENKTSKSSIANLGLSGATQDVIFDDSQSTAQLYHTPETGRISSSPLDGTPTATPSRALQRVQAFVIQHPYTAWQDVLRFDMEMSTGSMKKFDRQKNNAKRGLLKDLVERVGDEAVRRRYIEAGGRFTEDGKMDETIH